VARPAEKIERARVLRPRLLAAADLGETKGRILDAAFRALASGGYAALSMREIAREADVNHALINYHFRTKDQLVIAVLDEANRQLLARQRAMYGGPGGFARKWAEARKFYGDDIASGFVRVQAELWAASLSNPELREKFVPRILAWKRVVAAGVADAMSELENCGMKLPAPFTREVIATWICEFWVGMEFTDLLGIREDRPKLKEALDAVELLLEWLDARVRKQAAATRTRVAAKPRRKKP
jgi:AcrR family transcriptional regulator